MTGEREIARLLCGECPPESRTVMARIFDTPDGARFRSRRSRRPALPPSLVPSPTRIFEQDDVLIADLPDTPTAGKSSWRFTGAASAAMVIGCDRHGTLVVTSDYLRELEAEARRKNRCIVRVLDHPPPTKSEPVT